jgi:hypothetical protein
MSWYTNPLPTVTLSSVDNPSGLAGTLAYNAGQSCWVSSTTFLAAFDVAQPLSEVVVPDVSIYVTGARDEMGKTQIPCFRPNVFSIDITPP